MRTLGVPYAPLYEQQANADLQKQAEQISANLVKENITVSSDKEIIALIAYLQRLGTDIKVGNNAL
jgi:cytochrome c oxidase cbb3-type subunit I/II